MKSLKLIFLIGLPATGKTSLGETLQARTGIRYLDIDKIAYIFFGPHEREAYRTPEGRERSRRRMWGAYNVLCTATNFCLELGDSTIISATFSRDKYWKELFLPVIDLHREATGGQFAAKVIWLQIQHNEERIVDERVTRTHYEGGCTSVAHYMDDKSRYMPPPAHLPILIVDSSQPLESYLEQVLKFITE